jgi:hypothetical protein
MPPHELSKFKLVSKSHLKIILSSKDIEVVSVVVVDKSVLISPLGLLDSNDTFVEPIVDFVTSSVVKVCDVVELICVGSDVIIVTGVVVLIISFVFDNVLFIS